MARVKHIETRIVTVLGIEDDNGNIVQQVAVQADQRNPTDALLIRKFTPEAFAEAYQAILGLRAQVEEQAAAMFAPTPQKDPA